MQTCYPRLTALGCVCEGESPQDSFSRDQVLINLQCTELGSAWSAQATTKGYRSCIALNVAVLWNASGISARTSAALFRAVVSNWLSIPSKPKKVSR